MPDKTHMSYLLKRIRRTFWRRFIRVARMQGYSCVGDLLLDLAEQEIDRMEKLTPTPSAIKKYTAHMNS